MKTVYIVEDEMPMREFLIASLKLTTELTVVGSSGDGKEGYDQCLTLKPDLVILDLFLPSMQGTEILKGIKNNLPETIVLIFSGVYSTDIIELVIQGGADGFLEKTGGLDGLKCALNHLEDNKMYFGPQVTKVLDGMNIEYPIIK